MNDITNRGCSIIRGDRMIRCSYGHHLIMTVEEWNRHNRCVKCLALSNTSNSKYFSIFNELEQHLQTYDTAIFHRYAIPFLLLPSNAHDLVRFGWKRENFERRYEMAKTEIVECRNKIIELRRQLKKN